jgi:hypothetical protein
MVGRSPLTGFYPEKIMPSNFDIAIEKTLAHEGGNVNDPEDAGGQTKFGISRRAYPHIHISTLTRQQAIAMYKRDYWTGPGFNRISKLRLPDAGKPSRCVFFQIMYPVNCACMPYFHD